MVKLNKIVLRNCLKLSEPFIKAIQIEAIQKRALNIIYKVTYGMPYTSTLFLAGLTSLTEHREQ